MEKHKNVKIAYKLMLKAV
uniref:Uncharacterized protein n=1 Tax=Lepeophtheirus salmonis TaxID=72036 RepID=A0A0K2SWI0_LEPSM